MRIVGPFRSRSVARACARVGPGLDQAKNAQTVVSTRVVPGCVLFLGGRKRFYTVWITSVSLALHCKRPVYPTEPTWSGTASTEATGQKERLPALLHMG